SPTPLLPPAARATPPPPSCRPTSCRRSSPPRPRSSSQGAPRRDECHILLNLRGAPVEAEEMENPGWAKRKLRERIGIGHYLLAAFLTCLLGVGSVIALNARRASQHERDRTITQLKAAAQQNVNDTSDNAVEVLQS